MKIPIQLSFKLFNETTTIKTTVEDLHIGQTMDMYKNIMVPLFGEESYENTILSIADRIKEKRSMVYKPIVPPKIIMIEEKEDPKPKVYRWLEDIFKE
jgi:hypothetical protein